MTLRHIPRFALVLLCLAMAARVAVIVVQPPFTPVGDAAEYDADAVSLAASGHYPPSTRAPTGGPTTIRPPAYPYLLAGAYALTGTEHSTRRFVVGRLVGALLGTITVALIGVLAYLLWGRWASIAGMAIAAVYPQLVAISDSLLSETLFTPLVLAAVLCVLLQRRSGAGYRWAIGAGVFLGLTMLTRVNGVIISVGLLAGMWGLGPSRRVKGGALLILTSVLVILPWAVRDAVVFHTFVPLSDESGYTLAGTYNDISRTDSVNPAAWRPTPGPPYEAILRRRDLNEVQMNSKLEATALDYIGKHPTYLGKVVLWNGLRFLQVTGNSHEQLGARETGVGPTFSDVGRIAFWVLLTLACASIVLVSAARRVPSIVWSVPLLLLLSLIFVNASARYRTPMDAFLVLFAGALVAHLASLRPRAKSSAQPASLS